MVPLAPLRVVYAASGTNAAACIIRSTTNAIDNSLYWAALRDEQEARFLTALFNSETTRLQVESRQSQGQWGARHFHKVMFNLPIPRFDPADPLHNAIAEGRGDNFRLACGCHGLGEYYTPDWLAAKMVKHVIDRPLVEHVLDPACGSGTFLFHAIRIFLKEATEADMNPERRAAEVCARVDAGRGR